MVRERAEKLGDPLAPPGNGNLFSNLSNGLITN